MSVLEAERAPVRKRIWTALVPVLLAVAAVGITFAIALSDHVAVLSRSGLGHIQFGLPLVWLRQDQSSLDPSFPMNATLISPWDYPTSVSVVPLVCDVLVAFGLLLAGWFVVRRVGRRFSR